MQLSAITPVEFCRRFQNCTKLIHALLKAEYNSKEERLILVRMIEGRAVPIDEILSLPFKFRKGIVRVFDRVQYAENCSQRRPQQLLPEITHPLVDKTTNLVFDVSWGSHLFVQDQVMQVYSRDYLSIHDTGAEYILRGMGYFCTRASSAGIVIGKQLFDQDELDEYDEEILRSYRLTIVETVDDLKKIKGR